MIPGGTEFSIGEPLTRAPSIIIVGVDALLAAVPATPVQLSHACMRAGYQLVVPASWGDELIASAVVRQCAAHAGSPAIQCSCPLVAHRLLRAGADLLPFLISTVSPPVALARYLRAIHAPAKLRITYAGCCPGGADASIDARLTPDELLATLADGNIQLEDQPREFDSVLPPDRRRFRSQPSGVPAGEALRNAGLGKTLIAFDSPDLAVDLAQALLETRDILVDVGVSVGCHCAGFGSFSNTVKASVPDFRDRVLALEPPNAPASVIDDHVDVELDLQLPSVPRTAFDAVAVPARSHPTVPGRRFKTGAPLLPSGRTGASESDRPMHHRGETVEPTESEAITSSTAVAGNSAPEHAGSVGHASGTGGASLRRRSPVRSTSRVVVALPPPPPPSSPMPSAGRELEARHLPRAFVARRRVTPRGMRAPATAMGDIVATPAAPAVPPERPAPSAPYPSSKKEAPTASPATSELAAPTATTVASSATLSGFVPLPPTRHTPAPGIPRQRSVGLQERVVDLPVTTLPDRPSAGSARPASVKPTASNDTVEFRRAGDRPAAPQPTPTTAQITQIVILIALLMLVSVAVGVAAGRWLFR